ncbi:MAG: DNA-3-methyladenine glycosylase 2 family protein [Candidatus Marinimicrobia bacterium]|nr:DNA-3-methyladenine glycosylase 2 family protein [Candidatus Neomarinimicrobiota bacterium]MCF7827544.1 DNA-3-methyladenine glycosylase 2 family protein [Candidatus Neomarinimicrobiota bacterium]MCF7881594.1 DNA-3-methyladenine glycosylase 2 family protein [Candidatus Neomarinimicrobiota bacterium]
MNFDTFPLEAPFNLKLTLESGQFFQWRPYTNGFLIQHRKHFFYIEQEKHFLRFASILDEVHPELIRDLFRLNDDLQGIYNQWDDPILNTAREAYRGLRLMRQDPWECTLSFLCSMASNIPRITGNLRTLSERFGTVQDTEHGVSYRLPSPQELAQASLDELYESGVGFRAKYLYRISREIQAGFSLNALQDIAYPEAKTQLMTLHGIGEKVADCILLFSLNFLEAFPVDTWITKILKQYYFPGRKSSPYKLAALARAHFGEYAGYAQQYLFHYARHML